MASVSLKEAVRIMNDERYACIAELEEGYGSIFDSFERKKIHAYNLVIENIQRLARNGTLDWENTIEYY